MANDQTPLAETPAQPEAATSFIGRLMPSLGTGLPAQLTSAWPEAAYALWEGVVSSVAPNAIVLAAHAERYAKQRRVIAGLTAT